MATYTSEKRPKRLREGDTVVFCVNGEDFEYKVLGCYLDKLRRRANDAIFNALGLDRIDIASSAYGYYACKGRWPESKNRDFAALCRLVNALYAEIDKRIDKQRDAMAEELQKKVEERDSVGMSEDAKEREKPKLKFKVGDVVSGKNIFDTCFYFGRIDSIDWLSKKRDPYYVRGVGLCREEDIHLASVDGTISPSAGDTITLPKDFPPEFKEFIEFIVKESGNIRTIAYGVTARDGHEIDECQGCVGYYSFDREDRPYDALGISERLRHLTHKNFD
jgi:hypothetical protein